MAASVNSEERSQPLLIWDKAMPRSAPRPPLTAYQAPDGQGLYKLVLVVAEACNLRCTYCYAEGGPYGKHVSRMSPETARTSVQTMFTRHQPIRTLQFFGGEPTLNLEAMQASVHEVRQMAASTADFIPPRFSIVTNAMRMTDELIEFYLDTDMMITVSNDGPPDVQNIQRQDLRGRGSFATVDANLSKLKAAGVPFDVQCTYTPKHIKAGYRVPDLVRYFHEEVGARLVHIVPVTAPKGSEFDLFFSDHFEDMVQGYRETIRMTFQSMKAGRSLRFGMLEEALQLLKPGKAASNHYCNAGVTTLTVAANGDVYPCFMFINKTGFVMGHVDSGHALGAFARDPKHGMDFGCPGRQFMMNGEVAPFKPDEILKQAVVDEVLTCLTEILDEAEAELGIGRPADSADASSYRA